MVYSTAEPFGCFLKVAALLADEFCIWLLGWELVRLLWERCTKSEFDFNDAGEVKVGLS